MQGEPEGGVVTMWPCERQAVSHCRTVSESTLFVPTARYAVNNRTVCNAAPLRMAILEMLLEACFNWQGGAGTKNEVTLGARELVCIKSCCGRKWLVM
jgi:hypothetical protein